MNPAVLEDGWARLHPLTPLLRGGRFVLLVLAAVGQQGLRESPGWPLAAVLAVGVVAGALGGWLSWRATRYRVTPTELQVESGVLFRRSRRVPLARVQAVDVVRPLYARVLGLAELRLEVVGSGDAEAPLAFLPEESAGALRTQLLDLAAGRERIEGAPPPEPDRVLVVVPTGPLVWSTLLGMPAVTVAVLLVALAVSAAFDAMTAAAVLAAAFPVLLGVGSFAARRILGEYGFTVAESPDGLRLRHGLLDKRTQTIPPGRVQAIRVREPLLWKRFGWVRVEVDVAGYTGGGEEQAASGALLPVAPRALADALIARVLGGPLPAADVIVPPSARWRAPLQHRRLRIGLDARHVVASSGVVTTTTDIAPRAKVQSLRTTQGPYERRLGLASLHVDTAGRRLHGAVLRHRDAAEAAALLELLSRRTAPAAP